MDIRHHAAGAAAANSFEHRQRRFHQLRKFLDGISLIGAQGEARRGRNGQCTFTVLRLHLQDVSVNCSTCLRSIAMISRPVAFKLSSTSFRSPGSLIAFAAENDEPIANAITMSV